MLPILEGPRALDFIVSEANNTRSRERIILAQVATAIVLEPGTEVRIAEYRLTLQEASTIIDAGKADAARDDGEPWTSLGPGWLEQLHAFQREVLRLDQPRQVLGKLAFEFCRIAQPSSVAVGTAPAGGARDDSELIRPKQNEG